MRPTLPGSRPEPPARKPAPFRCWCIATAILVFGLPARMPVHAQEGGGCSLSSQTLTFGSINPLYSRTIYTSGTATLTCTGMGASRTIYACLSIGAGSASGSSTSSRALSASGSSARLPIVITNSPSSSQQIGTGSPYPQEGVNVFTTNSSGSGSTTFPISVAFQGPLTATAATYSNTFSGGSFRAYYRTTSSTACSQITSAASGGQMVIQAIVVASCTVSATALNFGSTSVLTTARTATSTITMSCTQGVTATIGFDYGQTGTAPTARRMTSGVNSIQYAIYQDAAGTLPWGQTAGSNTVSLPISGTSGNVTAYGVVPAQTTPPAGTYTDVVNVNVTY